ncbi:YciI family protein [Streptomyces sp. NPDC048304]|uniref:YciI family protein n=1 Tax=Streptomyces sp. NPDC048304 TaxID=3154820 RepID=UPI0033F9CD1F
MFVLELTYTAPLDAVDALLPDHVAWLEEQYEKGLFLASGGKNPRDGGMILAVAEDRARIEEVVAGDPFLTGGVCTYRIMEFTATKTAPELARHRQTPD